MITSDQPTIFPDSIIAGVSSRNNDNMKYLGDVMKQPEVDDNRAQFLKKLDIRPLQTVLVRTTYNGDDYNRYKVVGENNRGQGLVKPVPFQSDLLATQARQVALFLPLADCIGAILYDPVQHALVVSHLGRQHTEQHGAAKSIAFMTEQFGTQPDDLLVYLGPAPGSDSYPLFAFENRGLHEVNYTEFLASGVLSSRIEICETDTSKDPNYFSHSEFLKGKRETDGRYAIVAMMR